MILPDGITETEYLAALQAAGIWRPGQQCDGRNCMSGGYNLDSHWRSKPGGFSISGIYNEIEHTADRAIPPPSLTDTILMTMLREGSERIGDGFLAEVQARLGARRHGADISLDAAIIRARAALAAKET